MVFKNKCNKENILSELGGLVAPQTPLLPWGGRRPPQTPRLRGKAPWNPLARKRARHERRGEVVMARNMMSNHTDMQDKYCGHFTIFNPIQSQYTPPRHLFCSFGFLCIGFE